MATQKKQVEAQIKALEGLLSSQKEAGEKPKTLAITEKMIADLKETLDSKNGFSFRVWDKPRDQLVKGDSVSFGELVERDPYILINWNSLINNGKYQGYVFNYYNPDTDTIIDKKASYGVFTAKTKIVFVSIDEEQRAKYLNKKDSAAADIDTGNADIDIDTGNADIDIDMPFAA